MHDRRYAYILAVLILFHIAGNTIWLGRDTLTSTMDVLQHMQKQLKLHNRTAEILSSEGAGIVSGAADWIGAVREMTDQNNWPPFIYIAATALTAIFGYSVSLVRSTATLYLVLMLVAVFLIGREMHSRRAGLIAAAILSLYPAVYGASRMFELDLPLTAGTTVCMLLLVLTRGFTKRAAGIAFGMALGAGILVKGQILFFTGIPAVYVLLSSSGRQDAEGKRRVYVNALLSVSAAALVSALWWFGRIGQLGENLFWHTIAFYIRPNSETAPIWNTGMTANDTLRPGFFLFYLLASVALMSGPMFLAFAAGLPLFLRSSTGQPRKLIVMWMAVPYIILTLISIKWGRYIMPALPAAALATSIGLLQLKNRIVRSLSIPAVILIGLFQYFSVFTGQMPPNITHAQFFRMPLLYPFENFALSPQKNPFPQAAGAFAEEISQRRSEKGHKTMVAVGGPGDDNFAFFMSAAAGDILTFSTVSPDDLIEYRDRFEFFVLLDCSLPGRHIDGKEKMRQRFERWNGSQVFDRSREIQHLFDRLDSYSRIKRIRHPDGEEEGLTFTLYQRP